MKISDILLEESLISELQAREKQPVITELAEAICRAQPDLEVKNVCQVLIDREKLGSTGIGSGVAIPHGKIAGLDRIIAGFGRSQKGVDFDSQDGEPTHLIFVLIAPEDSAGLHLKALAKLSRLLKNSQFRDKLMEAEDRQSIYQAILEEDQKST